MRVKEDVSVQTEYFNRGGKTEDFVSYYYVNLGSEYEFMVTPLPTGQPLSIKTKSPG